MTGRPAIRPLTPEQEAELAAILADQAAREERWQAQRAQWRANIERRELERTLDRGSRSPDPSPWPPVSRRKGLVRKRLRTRIPCTAHRSSDGQPCGAWSIHGGFVCAAHGGRAPQVVAAAQRRLMNASITEYMAEAATRLARAREDAAAVLGRELARLDAAAAAAREESLDRGRYPLVDTGTGGGAGETAGQGGDGR